MTFIDIKMILIITVHNDPDLKVQTILIITVRKSVHNDPDHHGTQ